MKRGSANEELEHHFNIEIIEESKNRLTPMAESVLSSKVKNQRKRVLLSPEAIPILLLSRN